MCRDAISERNKKTQKSGNCIESYRARAVCSWFVNDFGMTLSENLIEFPLVDEEIGAEDGMKKFVTTEEFRSLNVGFSLDEGGYRMEF